MSISIELSENRYTRLQKEGMVMQAANDSILNALHEDVMQDSEETCGKKCMYKE